MTDRTDNDNDALPRPDAVVFGADGSKSYGYTAATVRRLLAERDAEIERLRNLLDDEIKAWHAALSGQMTEAQRLRTERVEQDERIARLTEALRFYAQRDHFIVADDDAWDTVSGEPPNMWCDQAGTATVEDGSVARAALEATHGR